MITGSLSKIGKFAVTKNQQKFAIPVEQIPKYVTEMNTDNAKGYIDLKLALRLLWLAVLDNTDAAQMIWNLLQNGVSTQGYIKKKL